MSIITREIVRKLNVDLCVSGYNIMFVFHEGSSNGLPNRMEAALLNDAGLRSYILNLTDSFIEYITNWFLIYYDVKLIANNTNTIFWASREARSSEDITTV